MGFSGNQPDASFLPGPDPRARNGHFVVGVGINTGGVPEGVPKATSLGEMLKRPVDRARLLRAVLRRMDRLYVTKGPRGRRDLEQRWREMSWTLGKRVSLLAGEERVRGKVTDLSLACGLTLRLRNGSSRTFRSEHVTLAE